MQDVTEDEEELEESEEEEEEETSRETEDDDPQDEFKLMLDSLNLTRNHNYVQHYRLTEDGKEVTIEGPQSRVLPVYEGSIAGSEPDQKIIIDSGATTLYLGEETAKERGLKVHKIKPRHVRVADHHDAVSNGFVQFEMKLGNLPPEIVTAYTFPLQKIDLVLGLP